MDLHGKRVLITGASSGIGREITVRLAQYYGCRIIVTARHTESLSNIPGEVYQVNCDMCSESDIDALLEKSDALLGGIDCVIACAGFGYFERFEGCDYSHINRIYDVNVTAPLYILQRLLGMTEGRVSFTVISSALGKMGLAGYSLYCSTKFALDGFARAYKYERPGRLHFMTVYPIGVKNTRFFRRISDNMPLPRPLQDVGRVASAVIRGIEKEKYSLYTSKPFAFALGLNRVLPFLFPIYQNIYRRSFEKWLEKKDSGR